MFNPFNLSYNGPLQSYYHVLQSRLYAKLLSCLTRLLCKVIIMCYIRYKRESSISFTLNRDSLSVSIWPQHRCQQAQEAGGRVAPSGVARDLPRDQPGQASPRVCACAWRERDCCESSSVIIFLAVLKIL